MVIDEEMNSNPIDLDPSIVTQLRLSYILDLTCYKMFVQDDARSLISQVE